MRTMIYGINLPIVEISIRSKVGISSCQAINVKEAWIKILTYIWIAENRTK